MILRFEYQILMDDLCDHYRRFGFRVQRVAPGLVDVGYAVPAAPEDESREVEWHLRVWETLHPEAPAEIVR